MENIDYRIDANTTVYIHIVPKDISGYKYDKYYVGITKCSTQKRWGNNGNGYKNNKHFKRAIEKYGWNNIEHEIIATNLTHLEACELEKTLIKILKANKKKYGYNKTAGGDGALEVEVSEETRKKLSEANKGEKNGFYGKHHSEETKLKFKNRPKMLGVNNPASRTIYQFDKKFNFIEKYDYEKLASEKYNLTNSIIPLAANKHHTAAGYYWVYEEDIININNEIQVKDKSIYKKPRNVPVYCFDKEWNYINKFPNLVIAANELCIFATHISDCIYNHKKTCGGFHWRNEFQVIEDKNIIGNYIPIIESEVEHDRKTNL